MTRRIGVVGYVIALSFVFLCAGCSAPNPNGTIESVPGPIRPEPYEYCRTALSGAMRPPVVDATKGSVRKISAERPAIVLLSKDCAHGVSVTTSPAAGAQSLTFYPNVAHAFAVDIPPGNPPMILTLTAPDGDSRQLDIPGVSQPPG